MMQVDEADWNAQRLMVKMTFSKWIIESIPCLLQYVSTKVETIISETFCLQTSRWLASVRIAGGQKRVGRKRRLTADFGEVG